MFLQVLKFLFILPDLNINYQSHAAKVLCTFKLNSQGPDSVPLSDYQNCSQHACVPWTIRADEFLCFVCKEAKDDLFHFLFVCPYFRKNFDSLWSNLDVNVSNSCPTDGSQISAFIKNLDQDSKALLLLGCLPLPFDSMTFTVITRFVASSIAKIYKLRTERLHELEAPWLRN